MEYRITEVQVNVLWLSNDNVYGLQFWEFILEWTTSLDSSSGGLFVRMCRCPRHVGRNYVPLFGVAQSSVDLRYYVICDVIVI